LQLADIEVFSMRMNARIYQIKLEECDVPVRLSSFQWVKYPEDWGKMVLALKRRANDFGIDIG